MAIEQIESITLSSSASSITFSNIPSVYTHLLLKSHFDLTDSVSIGIRVDDVTSSAYDSVTVNYGTEGTFGSSNQQQLRLAQFAGTLPSTVDMMIPNYTDTSKIPSFYFMFNGQRSTNANFDFGVGGGNLGQNVGAISKIFIFNFEGGTQTFNSGSTFQLYGVL